MAMGQGPDYRLLCVSMALAVSGLCVKHFLGPGLFGGRGGGGGRPRSRDPVVDTYEAELASRVGGCEAGDESAFCWMVQRHVDVGCRFSLRVGLSAEGVAAAGPALELRFDGGAARWTAEPHSLNASGAFAARQRLCAFSDPALDLAGPSPAVLVVANDLEYLFRLWPYFVNKVLWARARRVRPGPFHVVTATPP